MRVIQSNSLKIVIRIAILIICAICFLIYGKITDRISIPIYDALLLVKQKATNENITIIEIDDITIKQLGSNPSADINAKFIEKLFFLSPQAVVIDESINLDLQNANLLKSLTKIQNLYLSYNLTQEANLDILDKYYQSTSYTENLLRNSGHFIVNPDSDGIIRSIDSFYRKDEGDRIIPYAILNAYQKSSIIEEKFIQNISNQEKIFIPYNTNQYTRVSYIDILKNNVNPKDITGKYIIFGKNTYSAVQYHMPNSGIISALDIHAQAWQGFLDKNIIYQLDTIWQYAIAIVSILLSILSVWRFMPRTALLVNIIIIFGIAIVNIFAFYINIWFSPLPSILGVMLAYPMWIHYKMAIMTRFLDSELSLIDTKNLTFFSNNQYNKWNRQDKFTQRINMLRQAIASNEDMRQFINDNINAMPDIIIVTDLRGNIILSNYQADSWIKQLEIKSKHFPTILSTLSHSDLMQPKHAWQDILEQAYHNAEYWQKGVEIKINISKIKYALLRIVPSNNRLGVMVSWLCTLHDLTEQKQMEQQRDEMMRFLSHDMRSPQSSIIASIELHRKNSNYREYEEILLKKIENHAYHTLTLAEEFVQMAKAETQNYEMYEINISNVIMDVVDDMWSLAQQKNIKINQKLIDDIYVIGDRLLLTRCITNLLSNAIKYTLENRQIWIKMRIEKAYAVIDIIDEGPGISPENQKKLFERFVRFEETKHIEGVGLGLAFVKVVIDKHNGKITCNSAIGKGCQFSVFLPLAPPDGVV